MIGQYLPQTNKNITVAKFKKFHELNQAFENRHTFTKWGFPKDHESDVLKIIISITVSFLIRYLWLLHQS